MSEHHPLSIGAVMAFKGYSENPAVKTPRLLRDIAADIRRNWPNVYFGAVPYLNAMRQLDSVRDTYGADDARGIVLYFLSNARTWKGEHARRIKAELNALLKG